MCINMLRNYILHCKNESVYSTPLGPNTHTVYGLVCVLGQFSVQYTLLFLQCSTVLYTYKQL